MLKKTLMVLIPFLFAITICYGNGIDDLKIMTEEYPPFNYMKDGKLVGLGTEIVVEMLKRTNSKLGKVSVYAMA